MLNTESRSIRQIPESLFSLGSTNWSSYTIKFVKFLHLYVKNIDFYSRFQNNLDSQVNYMLLDRSTFNLYSANCQCRK